MAGVPIKSSFHPSKKPSDPERWICIYPSYIDCHKSLAEGRRIPKKQAVDKPTIKEIYDVLVAAQFKVGVERKFYPRDGSKEEERCGRVRVQLKNDDGSLVNSAFPSRDAIFLHLGHKIPELKTRQNKATSDQSNTSATSSSVASKKKGKGGRR